MLFKGTCGQTVIQIAYCVTAITEVSVTVLVWGVGGEQIDQTTVFEGTDGVFAGIGVQVAYHQDVGIIVGFVISLMNFRVASASCTRRGL